MEVPLVEKESLPKVVVPEASQFSMASVIYGALICLLFYILNNDHFLEYLTQILRPEPEPELSDWEKLCESFSKNLRNIFS